MGVAVFHPQDCLREGVSYHHRRLISPPRSKPRRSSGPQNTSPTQTRSGRRKQWSPASSPPPPQSKPNNDDKSSYRAKSPDVTGQVRILKRGEELTPKLATAENSPLKNRKSKREGSIDRVNSDPLTLSIHRKSPEPAPAPMPNLFLGGFYAGSAFSTSPSPSSLPLPGFCTNSVASGVGGLTLSTAEDVVAVDLRRLLRIE